MCHLTYLFDRLVWIVVIQYDIYCFQIMFSFWLVYLDVVS